MASLDENARIRRFSGPRVAMLALGAVGVGLGVELFSEYLESIGLISHAYSHFMTICAIFLLVIQPFYVVFRVVRVISVRLCIGVGVLLIVSYHLYGMFDVMYPGMFKKVPYLELAFQPFSISVGFALILLALYFALVNVANAQADLREERVQLLQEIRERVRIEETLRERDGRYRALIDTTGTGFVVVDAKGHVLDANTEYVRVAGYRDLTQIFGRPVTDWIVPRDHDRIVSEFRKCFERGKVRNLEVGYLGRDGGEIAVEMSAMLIESKRGPMVLSLCRDIDARKKAEAELVRSSRMAALGVMAAGLAHEIGNPLASLSTRISLLAEENASAFVKESVGVLQTQIARIAQIVHGVSRFSRTQNQGLSQCDVNALITETFDIIRFHEKARQCQLATEFAQALPEIPAWPDQLTQVFLNLGLNALEAMPEGGSLLVRTYQVSDCVAVAFVDTGSGFTPETRNRMFDTFYTSKADGMGLGLSIAHNIVSRHGGRIEAENNPGGGACFTVFLPMRRPNT